MWKGSLESLVWCFNTIFASALPTRAAQCANAALSAAVIYWNCFYRFLTFSSSLSWKFNFWKIIFAVMNNDDREMISALHTNPHLSTCLHNFTTYFPLFTIISAIQTLQLHFCVPTFQLRMKISLETSPLFDNEKHKAMGGVRETREKLSSLSFSRAKVKCAFRKCA